MENSYHALKEKQSQAAQDLYDYEQRTLKKKLEWSEELRNVYKGMIAN